MEEHTGCQCVFGSFQGEFEGVGTNDVVALNLTMEVLRNAINGGRWRAYSQGHA